VFWRLIDCCAKHQRNIIACCPCCIAGGMRRPTGISRFTDCSARALFDSSPTATSPIAGRLNSSIASYSERAGPCHPDMDQHQCRERNH
jgi:hypothetical protein